jgi:hypothetical protein
LLFVLLKRVRAANQKHRRVFGAGGSSQTDSLSVLGSSLATPNPGNLLSISSPYPNTLYYNETFGPALNESSATFSVSSAAATGYAVTLDVKNTSSEAWSGYTLYSGGGTIVSPSYFNGFTFDTIRTPTIANGGGSPSWGNGPNNNNNWLVWSGLNVAPTSTITLEFNFDVSAGFSGDWAITQEPVPEPCSMAILALGIVSLIRWRGRR